MAVTALGAYAGFAIAIWLVEDRRPRRTAPG
jgi:hypothetical protein